ncbi:MAG: RnfH family protein [Gammaproteobacteria bacterium]|nr:RnfH family protein [Gammaproteobacteria bacterium]NIR82841.1 RnfH family protein [Gammaproteobacteria bacterium]NIR89950.1 RnfH family protein [Gammaproteobacteria bacterium]NIU03999.1 RnfH family protein [Gammaproteobacteria bacterium]NIV51319.1 RnfH family protein [Gammaproteobacteria bacterium]
MTTRELISVEVAYARPDVQVVIPLRVPPGATVEAAIRASGILERFPEIDLSRHRVGVFGKLTEPDRTLEAGDRVEIYRPLVVDPKTARRRRARRRGSSGVSRRRRCYRGARISHPAPGRAR